ncbi:MAG: ATP-binding protein [Monoglobaceae bacterium]
MREFDLNIEKVLENWTVAHAIREIIANALDEQILTGTEDIAIYQDTDKTWHIRDYGRGIQYHHLTQNENEEKQQNMNLIGKFGVGLKDALATFDRHGIEVVINSRYGHITIGQSTKHGFSDITTLHAYIDDPLDRNFIGTDFAIRGCTHSDINTAKDLFLCFTEIETLEKSEYGEILEKRNDTAEIFINGIKVAEEDNFLFSYNITSLNSTLRKALNRERTNVGRTAYSERIKAILLSAHSNDVLETLTDNLEEMSSGRQSDELKWVEVQKHAVKHLNAREDTVFVTPDEIKNSSGVILDIVKSSGKTPVFVTETVMQKISDDLDVNGNQISTISSVVRCFNESFQYDFVDYKELSESERSVFDITEKILKATDSHITKEQIYISNCLQPDFPEESFGGVWEPFEERIIIHRQLLGDMSTYSGVLIHELTHADTGLSDVSRAFETALTKWIGHFAAQAIKQQ